jgi:hypothetical protein
MRRSDTGSLQPEGRASGINSQPQIYLDALVKRLEASKA